MTNTFNHDFVLVKARSSVLYIILLLLIIVSFASLPFIHTTISVRSAGIIRPAQERTEIKSIATGIIDTIFYKEGAVIAKGAVLLRVKDNTTPGKLVQAKYEIKQRSQFVSDLHLLTSVGSISMDIYNNLSSPLYRQQISRFLYQQAEQQSLIKKARYELGIDSLLEADKVIAPKELFDKKIENEKLQAAYSAFKQEQLSIWQQDLVRYRLELAQLQNQQLQLTEEAKYYLVHSSVAGTVQGINTRYAGGVLQAGETVAIISPEGSLIAECYVSTTDVGLLQQNQRVKFQVDAFDYNYFGILTGKIQTIDNDFTLIDNQPVFKVKCMLDASQLYLKNGYKGNLKKGMTLQARFTVAERSLWQLLWDTMDDWFNPASPHRIMTNKVSPA